MDFRIAKTSSGPMGTYPKNYPVIFKPIINLFGMSRSFKIIKSKKEYNKNLKDGLFWMKYLDGTHLCIDLILLNGNIKFFSCLKSHSFTEGTFLYHESIPDYLLNENIIKWINKYFYNYTGCLNIETINDIIIEAHLRLNGDYNLYNDEFTKELHNLYNYNTWNLDYKIKKLFLISIFINFNYDVSNINFHDIIKIIKYHNCNNIVY